MIFLLYMERKKKKMKSCSCFFIDGKQEKAREFDAITFKSHACIVVIHDMIDFENSLYANQKRYNDFNV